MIPQELKKLETSLLDGLKKYIQTGDTVIAGVSGGPDSVFLLYILKQLPIKVIIAHVNHLLRKEASADESFVKSLLQNKDPLKSTGSQRDFQKFPVEPGTKTAATLLFESLKADIKSISRKSKQGLEETGRKVRYDFFKKLADKHRAKYILTAHHADDNLETVIMNLARGAGLHGLTGMMKNEKIAHKSLLRPLLDISKDQILHFLKFKKIPFRLDKSNDSTIYKRNFIRHKIVPLLKKLNPNISATLARNNENLREINDFMKTTAEEWLKNETILKSQLPGKVLKKLHPALQKSIILEIYQDLTGSLQNLKAINLKEILELISSNEGNKQKKIGKLTFHMKNNIVKFKK